MPSLRDIGFAFFIGGLLLVVGYGVVKALLVGETPGLIKLGLGAIIVGVLILMVTLIQEQYSEDDEGVDRKY